MHITLYFALLSLLYCTGEGKEFSFVAGEVPELDAAFYPQIHGWLGADSSYSLPLNGSTYLWLFGDTFVGSMVMKNGKQERSIDAMPHNSVGFVDPTHNIPHFWYRTFNNNTINNMGVFSPQYPTITGEYYWIVAGIMAPSSGKLIILAMAVYTDHNISIGFQQVGTDVILVDNPQDAPWEWRYNTSRITQTTNTFSLNSGIAFVEGHFYLLGLCNNDALSGCKKKAVMARITEKSLITFKWSELEFWTGSKWDNKPERVVKLYSSTDTEGTIQYHKYMQRWFVMGLQAFDYNVYIRTAPELTGPWSTQIVYRVPPPYNNTDMYFAYAAKSHPEYATDNEIIFSYNINSAKGIPPLITEVNIYHPKFIRLTISSRGL